MKLKAETIQTLLLSIALLALSPNVFAAPKDLPWTLYLGIVLIISAIGAFILSVRNKSAETLLLKILLGGLYFWVITFAQLTLLGGVYHFTQ